MKIGIAAALSLTLFCNAALAATDPAPRKFAVMSLIGDSLTVILARPEIGSHVDKNETQTIDDKSGALDMSALHAVEDAIRTVDAGAAPILLATDSPVLYKKQGDLISGQHLVDADGLVGELKKAGATDFLLITKHRAPAALKSKFDTFGSGSLTGLGFYIDGSKAMQRDDTDQIASGYLAPYAYFKITLVDVATLAVEKEVEVTDGYVLSNARNQSDTDPNPWNVLSPTEKFAALAKLIKSNVVATVPGMIAKGSPAAQPSTAKAAATADGEAPN